ncbi:MULTISPECIES: ABC transporter ATP-binding protein [Auritidibacter]|uniref:ABC transporter ATP-binding protein n=1 Tax=Auritidibacter ignavus TaxID=678932 RepID=A0AAJ6AHY9_9MICC|nr:MULTISPECIES: ABC transporter ATP-binding protein [Auritidibacter]PXA78991.1 ABC transporter ATP-binding protein [Auritidibacter sp. NML120779]AXR73946.1 ABC transporter ATP-binding protein [Auritidibacter sp. NML130574]WGH84458.1 ABC transporter ATP-binding protein [Auritidibacter ignavus]WGH93783.1 ABC transporter ATP-binding protein [Auritidibacter ignavus]WHS27401.1 ABC transporter ATP-binding protein [Auritidibacter ignavus]
MTEPAILVEHIRKTFKSTVAVDDVSLTVAPGEVVGLLGANGAGKSTTVDMIAGLQAPDAGRARVLGRDPRRDKEVRQLLGVQLQEVRLHEALTVQELIDLYRSFYLRPRPAQELLDMVQLDSKRNTRFSALSGGQQQRLSIALALVGQPQVVILDELTTGLDPAARRRIWKVVESLTDEAILLVSHAMDEVERLCDRVVLLDAGRVIAEGTPEQVVQRAEVSNLEEAFVALTGKEMTTATEEGEE